MPPPNRPDWKPEDTLWKTIQRYDSYFGATNAKAAFLIAYYTFSLGVIVVQLGNIDLIAPVTSPSARLTFAILTLATAIVTVLPLSYVLRVIMPYLRSNKRPGIYHSIIYYADVAEHQSPESYAEQIKGYDSEKVIIDLSRQAHVLAQGLTDKFRLLQTAISITRFGQLPFFVALFAFVVWRRW
jgi:hypothetical protein